MQERPLASTPAQQDNEVALHRSWASSPPTVLNALSSATATGGVVHTQSRDAGVDSFLVEEEAYRTEGVLPRGARMGTVSTNTATAPAFSFHEPQATDAGHIRERKADDRVNNEDGAAVTTASVDSTTTDNYRQELPHTSHSSGTFSLQLAALRAGYDNNVHTFSNSESAHSASEVPTVDDRSPRAPMVLRLFNPSCSPVGPSSSSGLPGIASMSGGPCGFYTMHHTPGTAAIATAGNGMAFTAANTTAGSSINSACGSCTPSPRLTNPGMVGSCSTGTLLCRCHLSRRDDATLSSGKLKADALGGGGVSYGQGTSNHTSHTSGAHAVLHSGHGNGTISNGRRYSPQIGGSRGSSPGGLHRPQSISFSSFYQDPVHLRGASGGINSPATAFCCVRNNSGVSAPGGDSGPSEPLCPSVDTYGAGRGQGGCDSCPSCLLEGPESLQPTPRPVSAAVTGVPATNGVASVVQIDLLTGEEEEETLQPYDARMLSRPFQRRNEESTDSDDDEEGWSGDRLGEEATETKGEPGRPSGSLTAVAPPSGGPPAELYTRRFHLSGTSKHSLSANAAGTTSTAHRRSYVDPAASITNTLAVVRYTVGHGDGNASDWDDKWEEAETQMMYIGKQPQSSHAQATSAPVAIYYPPVSSVSPTHTFDSSGKGFIERIDGMDTVDGRRSAAGSGPSSMASTTTAAGEACEHLTPHTSSGVSLTGLRGMPVHTIAAWEEEDEPATVVSAKARHDLANSTCIVPYVRSHSSDSAEAHGARERSQDVTSKERRRSLSHH